MSILKLELKKEHILLLKHLKWFGLNNKLSSSIHDDSEENGLSSVLDHEKYEYIDVILNGIPENFEPLNTDVIKEFSEEQKAEWDMLYNELPIALSIILQTGSFEVGFYKAKYHDQVWKNIEKI